MWGLKELAPPEPVSWLPATPGWLLVGAVLLALFAWLVWRRARAWQRGRYRREALARLDRMRASAESLAGLPGLLRATALTAFPRAEVASLRGRAWVDWLNAHGGRFGPDDAECLDRLPYDPAVAPGLPPELASRLLDSSRAWLREHRAQL